MSQSEIWRDVPNYEGMYKVSNLGRVKSLKRKGVTQDKVLTPALSGGYLSVSFTKNDVRKTMFNHRLVAYAFLNHKPSGMDLVVNHINLDKTDNRLENLEIVSSRENSNKKHLDSISKYTGVTWHYKLKKWKATIWINRKNKHLGYFDNEIDAHNAYQKKLKEIS